MSQIKIKIFISSPGDVGQERFMTQRVLKRLQGEFLSYVSLEPILWEHEPLRATAHFQEQIVLPSSADIVVCILWSRLGTRLPENYKKPDGTPYSSGTEWEFEDAARSFREKKIPDLLVYRKTEEPPINLNDDKSFFSLEQKKALDAFIDRWFGNPENGFNAAFHTFQSLDEFESRLEEHLRKLILSRIPDHIAEDDIPITWFKGSPFMGLKAFDSDHSSVFYGRTKEIGKIKEALCSKASMGCAFLLILGKSGCGKSSLLKAGVIPNITQPGVIEGVEKWQVINFRPGSSNNGLLEGFAKAISEKHVETLVQLMKDDMEGFVEFNKDSKSSKLLIYIDQMEEIFTLETSKEEDRKIFISALSALSKSGFAWVIATMRSDFYARCAELPELIEMKEGKGHFDLMPPNLTEIGHAIRYPSRAAGVKFEKDVASGKTLDEFIIEAAEGNPDVLPLLEFTLDELYKKRSEENILTFEAYNELGGLEGALSKRAEDVLSTLDFDVDAPLKGVFRQLITIEGKDESIITGRLVPLSVAADEENEKKLVEALIAARLLFTDSTSSFEVVIGVSHEALLHHWPRLQRIIEEDKDFFRIRGRINESYERWEIENKNSDFLLSEGKPLIEAEDILLNREKDIDPKIKDYIKESIKKYKRLKRRKIRAITAAFTIIFAFAIVSFTQWQTANAQRNIADTQKQEALKQKSYAEAQTKIANNQTKIADEEKIKSQNSEKDALAQKKIAEEKTDEALEQRKLALLQTDIAEKQKAEALLQKSIAEVQKNEAIKQKGIANERTLYAENQTALAVAQRNEAFKTQSLFLSDLSRQKNEEGDTVSAMLLAREALPKDFTTLDRPFIPEAENALNDSIVNYRETKIVKAQDKAANFVKYTKDGNHLITTSVDGTIKIWNSNDLSLERTIAAVNDPIDKTVVKVNFATMSSDGNYLAATYNDAKVRIYSTLNWSLVTTIAGNNRSILSTRFSPDGKIIVTTSQDHTIRIWDVLSGKRIKLINCDSYIFNAIISNDGKLLAYNGQMDPLTVVNIYGSGDSFELKGHADEVDSIVFSPDDKYLVSTSQDTTVRVWDISKRNCAAILRGHTSDVYNAFFSSDGKSLSTVSLDNTVRIWSMLDFTQKTSLVGHKDTVKNVYFTHDNNYIITSGNSSIGIWYAESGQNVDFVSGFKGTIYSTDISPDNKNIAVTDISGYLTVFKIEKQNNFEFGEYSINASTSSISNDGKFVVATSTKKYADVINIEKGEIVASLKMNDLVTAAIYSHKGDIIATLSYYDNKITLWNSKTYEKIKDISIDTGTIYVYNLKFSPDDKLISFSNGQTYIKIYDVEKGSFVDNVYANSPSQITGKYSFSPDSKCIAFVYRNNSYTTATDNAAYVYNIITKKFSNYMPQKEYISSVKYSPDGSKIITSSSDKTAILWDVATEKAIHVFSGHIDSVSDASFSPDGKKIITASWDGTVRIWDTNTGELLRILNEGKDELNSATFSRDGKRIVACSFGTVLKIYNTDTGNCESTIKGVNDPNYACFTPDGEYLLISDSGVNVHGGAFGDVLRIYHLPPTAQSLCNYTESILPRQLTEEEKKKYYIEYDNVDNSSQLNLNTADSYSSTGTTKLSQFKDYDGAEKCFTKALQILNVLKLSNPNDKSIDTKIIQNNCYYAISESVGGHYQNGLDLCNNLLKQYPGDPFVLKSLGHCYLISGQFDKAKEVYTDIKDLKNGTGITYLDDILADLRAFQKNTFNEEEAKKMEDQLMPYRDAELTEGLKVTMNLVEDYSDKGDNYLLQDNVDMARDYYYYAYRTLSSLGNEDTYSKIFPDIYALIYSKLSYTEMYEDNYESALTYAQKSDELKQHPIIKMDLCLSYLLYNNYDKAKEIADTIKDTTLTDKMIILSDTPETVNDGSMRYIMLKVLEGFKSRNINSPNIDKMEQYLSQGI